MSLFTIGVFYSSLGDLWAFLPIYLPTIAAANSNVPFSLEVKILGTLHVITRSGVATRGNEEKGRNFVLLMHFLDDKKIFWRGGL